MSNGDVLWAWVAGILVSLGLLVLLSRAGERTVSTAYDENFTLPEATLGAAQWDRQEWELTGGTPPHRSRADDALYDMLDLFERIVPEHELLDGNTAVAEEPPKN